jgi:hypothetical protein
MGRPLGSKNKQKCCTALSHCLTTQGEAQDEEHMEREIQNVLAVIKGVDAESDSKNESEYDDSVLDKDFEMSVDQCESHDRPTTSTQASKSPKKTQLDKAASSQKAGKSTQVTTLTLSTTNTGSGRIKNKIVCYTLFQSCIGQQVSHCLKRKLIEQQSVFTRILY